MPTLTLTDLLIEQREKQKKYFVNPKKYARVAKKVVAAVLPDVKAFLFGSVIEGQTTPGSDIDLLIASPKMPVSQNEQAKIKVGIARKIGAEHPFEIHLVTPAGLFWYNRFIKRKVEV